MPTVDTRPTGVDFRVLRGAAKTIRFRYPTSQAGRTFTLTIEGITAPLNGTVSTTDVTFAITAEILAAMAGHAGWTLTDTTGVDQVQLVGQFHPSMNGGDADDETVTVVTTDEITVDVAIVGAPGEPGPAGADGPPGADGADGPPGVVAAASPATYDPGTRTVGVDQAAIQIAGTQITSGTIPDARIPAAIARDTEVSAAVAGEATARDAAIETHRADTTDVHGIADTALLATQAYVLARIAEIVNGAPGTLDALNELAAALGNDPNFATSMATALGLKANADASDITAATWRTALGLVIGTNVQAYDADLAAIAALTTTSYGRGLLTDADATAFTARLTALLNGTYVSAFLPEAYGAYGDYNPVTQTGHDDTAAIQAAINAAQAVGGKVVLGAKYYKVTTPPTITAPITIEGQGVQKLHGTWATEGYWSMGFPNREPFLRGSVIVQCGAGQHGLIDTPTYGSSTLRGFGILFDKTIRYTNTGHGIYAPAGTVTTYGGPDNGVMSGVRDDIVVFGHDGNHYAYYCVNSLYCTWGHVQSYGGGGLYWENNTGTGGQPNHYYGNHSAVHMFFVVFLAGTADCIKVQNVNGGAANLFHWSRVQGVTWNIGSIAGVTVTPPTSSQYLMRFSPYVDYLTITSPDFETSVSSPILLPTFGNIFMGIGGAFPTNPRLFLGADAAVKDRAMYSDLSGRLAANESVGGKWKLVTLPDGTSLAVATDGTKVVTIPGALQTDGMTGATSAVRFVGGVDSVAPTTGTFAVGDFVISRAGDVLICTTAGTPGTWKRAGGDNRIFVQGTDPAMAAAGQTGVWVQTGLAPGGAGFTFWIEDGS